MITRNLVDDLDNGRLSLVAFYVRRLARLQPALYGVLLATLTGGVLMLAPEKLHHVRKATVAAAVSLANIWFWTTDDYFSPAIENNPLLHTWPLAVEEQFYLVWPLALLGLHRVSRRVMVGWIAIATIGSLGAALFFSRTAPSAVFYLTPFRVYSLGAGALLALTGAPHRQRWTQAGRFQRSGADPGGAPLAPGSRSSPLVVVRRRERCPHDARTLVNGVLLPRWLTSCGSCF